DASGGGGTHVAKDIVEQILSNPKAIAAVSVMLALTGFVPGFPKAAFWTFSGIAAILSFPRLKSAAALAAAAPAAAQAAIAAGKKGGPGDVSQLGSFPKRLYPPPAVLELGKDLERLFTHEDGTARPEARKALEEGVREFLSEEMGMTFPAVSLRIENPHLRPTD